MLLSLKTEPEKNDEEVPKLPEPSDQAMIDTIMSSVNAGFEQVDKRIE